MSEFSLPAGNSDRDVSQSSFWSHWQNRYSLRNAPPAAYPQAAAKFWLTDDMDYRVGELKDLGVYASVWKANKKTTGRLLVVKRFEASQTPNFQARIRNEAAILDRIRVGPHIVQAGAPRYNTPDRAKGIKLMVEIPMEYYHYNLSQLLQQTTQERGFVQRTGHIMIPSWYNTVLFQMLDAVAFLHSMHIMVVNRDINPTNILFSKNDSFILAGFSLARVGIPRPGEYWEVRDQRYLPPEVHKRRAERTAVDIWALGILCLDMLNMLPKVGVNEDTNDPALFRQLNWCGRMSALASRTGRPELQTTVVKEVEQRISATLLRQRMKRHSGTWPRSFRPSLSLLHVLMREDSTYSHLNEEEIVPYAGRYLEDHPSMSQPSTSASQRTINPHQQPSPYQQPRSPYQQPRSPYQQPISPYQQPISPYQQPISPFQHPQSPFQQPIFPFQQPIFPFQQPIFPYQQPISPYQQPMSPYQQPISLYHQTMGFQSTARAEMIARTGAQELADLPLRRLYILRQEMERPGLDSRIGMQAFRGSEGITAPSTSTILPFPATLAQAAAESRSATNRPRGGRSKGKQAEAKAKQKEGEAGIRLGEAKAGATATEEKAEAMATGTKPEATGTEVNVAPSKLTSGRDLRLGRSSEERPTVRGATSGSGSAKASPLAKSQPTERQGQSPRITEILSRKGDAKAQSRSPSSRNLATSSFHGVEQVSQPQQRDRARPGPSSDSSRQVQTRIGQRQVKDEQPTTLSAPPPPSRGRSAGSTRSVITQPRPSQESSPSSVKSKPDSSEGEAEAR